MNKLVILALFAAPLMTHAKPSVYSHCPSAKGPVAHTLFSSDCKTLYVLPSNILPEIVSDPIYAPDTQMRCEKITSIQNEIVTIANEVSSEIHKLTVFHQAHPDMTDAEWDIYAELVDKVYKRVDELNASYDPAYARFREASRGPGLKFTVKFDKDNDVILKQYQKLNPELKVVKMPMVREDLSINERSADKWNAEALSSMWSATKNADGYSATYELSYVGACGYPTRGQLSAYTAATYTYWYDAQTEGNSSQIFYGTSAFDQNPLFKPY